MGDADGKDKCLLPFVVMLMVVMHGRGDDVQYWSVSVVVTAAVDG